MPAVSRPLPGIAVANREVLARMVPADPVLLDGVPAADVTAALDALARAQGAA
jgi:hypothetical protein